MIARPSRRLLWHDAHYHLMDAAEPAQMAARLRAECVDCLAVTSSPEQFHALQALLQPPPGGTLPDEGAPGRSPKLSPKLSSGQTVGRIFPALGLFPLRITDDLEAQRLLGAFESLLPQSRFLGELGLDFSAPEPLHALQVRVLKRILAAAAEQHAAPVLSLHSRRAGPELISLLRDFTGTAILHWYSGPIPDWESLPEGLWFSVNPAMLGSRSGRLLLAALPMERILLESDGPYVRLPPDERGASPLDLSLVLYSLAQRRGLEPAEVAGRLQDNWRRALALS